MLRKEGMADAGNCDHLVLTALVIALLEFYLTHFLESCGVIFSCLESMGQKGEGSPRYRR